MCANTNYAALLIIAKRKLQFISAHYGRYVATYQQIANNQYPHFLINMVTMNAPSTLVHLYDILT